MSTVTNAKLVASLLLDERKPTRPNHSKNSLSKFLHGPPLYPNRILSTLLLSLVGSLIYRPATSRAKGSRAQPHAYGRVVESPHCMRDEQHIEHGTHNSTLVVQWLTVVDLELVRVWARWR